MAAHELISFGVGDESYGLPVTCVREIRIWSPATPIPHAPPCIRGMINLRGAIMPVVDLRARLDQGATEVTPRHVIIVVQSGALTAGLLVDAVEETFVIDDSDVQAVPAVSGEEAPLVDGIIVRGETLLSRLDVDALLPARLLAA